MTSKQKNAVKDYVGMVKDLAKQTNTVRVKLEEIAGDAFLELSCEGKANSEEVRLFDGGNNRLNEAEHIFLEALAFYGELLGDESLVSYDPCGEKYRKYCPTVEETATSPRPAVRRHRKGVTV